MVVEIKKMKEQITIWLQPCRGKKILIVLEFQNSSEQLMWGKHTYGTRGAANIHIYKKKKSFTCKDIVLTKSW